MEYLSLVVLVITGVLISSILERFIPRVSLPLVQIALGVVWYFTPFLPTIQLDSELFMMLFIAPLLFNAARSTSIPKLRRVLWQALWLAIGLVFLCIVVTGVTLHAFWPAISLAAAMALGAALAPTDAIAVTQMGKQARLTERQMQTLEGESLFNDAASIVSFNFAVAAAMTGEFSPVDFTLEVIYSFIGGVVFGFIAGKVIDWLVTLLRRHLLETTTNRITIEILTPFLIYTVSENIGISPVLAVVTAGLTIGFHRRGVGSDIARVNLVSNSVWEFLEFTLNGSIFVLLGMQLPIIFLDYLDAGMGGIGHVLAAALLLTVVSLTVRFAGVALMLRVSRDERTGLRRPMTRERWHSALVMTFGGAKGAITISLVFTLPLWLGSDKGVPVRSLLWAIAAAFVMISLILTNVMLPLLAPRGKDMSDEEFTAASRRLLTTVLERLAQTDTPETHTAVQIVMRSYTYRMARLSHGDVPQARIEEERKLRCETLAWERQWLADYAQRHPEYKEAADRYSTRISRMLSREKEGGRSRAGRALSRAWWTLVDFTRRALAHVGRKLHRSDDIQQENTDLTAVHIALTQATIGHLFDLVNDPDHDAAVVTALMGEYRSSLATTRLRGRTPDEAERLSRQLSEVRARAYSIELDTIRDMADAQEITRDQARAMRRNVHLMETDMGM